MLGGRRLCNFGGLWGLRRLVSGVIYIELCLREHTVERSDSTLLFLHLEALDLWLKAVDNDHGLDFINLVQIADFAFD